MPTYPKLRAKGKRTRERIANGKTTQQSTFSGLAKLVAKFRGHW